MPTCNSTSLSQIDPTLFFNSFPQALLFLSAKGDICTANTAFYKLSECEDSDLDGQLLSTVFEHDNHYIKFIEAKLPSTGILWLKQFSGNSIKVVVQRSEFQVADNISSMLSIYSFDEDGLGSHFVAGITNDGCWAWNVVQSTTWRSPRWLEIAARTHEPAKLDADEVSAMFEFINASETRERIKQKLMKDSSLVEGEGYLKYLDGRRKHLSWQGLVVAKNLKGEPILSMGSIRDMTPFIERNVTISQARDNVAHQARLLQLGETLATVSHELNQPLSAIASYASVCKRNINSNTENGRIISEIETQALRAGTLLRRIREFAQRGEHDVRSDICLIPVLTDVVDWMQTDWRCRDMRFVLSISAEIRNKNLKVKCHRVEIEQITINLIINAAAAVRTMETPRQTDDSHNISISVNVIGTNNCIEMTIADRGPGICEDLLENIFVPFTTSRKDGLGLGLSISKSIANNLGGTLEYKPRYDGGALFILSIPISRISELERSHATL